jgi:hypothetical protein
VKGLHIESVNYRKARLMPPTNGYTGAPFLVTIEARDVDFWNFRINIPAGPIEPTINAGGGAGGGPLCEVTYAAILGISPNLDIRGNYIRGTGENTYSGACGLGYGIVLAGAPTLGVIPDVSGPNVSSVSHNRVLDFKFGGILTEGDDVQARIVRNAIRFIHEDDPASCVLVPVTGVQGGIPELECTIVENNTGLNGFLAESGGIIVEGSLVEIRANTVYSTFDVALFGPVLGVPGPGGPAVLGTGIVLFQADPDSTVRNNTVTNTEFGIFVEDGFFLQVDEPADNPDGVQVTGNRSNDNVVGLFVVGSDGVYYANRARTNFAGIVVEAGEDNLFQANDARFNLGIDCLDETTGTGDSGTANWWTNETAGRYNLGENDSPDGICIPTFFDN